MTTHLTKLTRLIAVAAALLTALPALAALDSHGPADPTLVWPQWYRDTNGTTLGLCKSQVVDANVGSSYCFPLDPNPLGFAGNVGDEIFYSNLSVDVVGSNGFDLLYEAALEAAYIPGPNPTHGQEVVFSRLRFLMNNPVPGTYTVIHPYGVQVFPDVQTTGKRSVFFTIDLPPGIPLDFAGALAGNIGPFPQTTVADATGTLVPTLLTLTNPANGTVETFLGDGNTPVTFTGSPFNTNFVRVIGPPGSFIGGANPDGSSIDEIQQDFGTVLGQVWTTPIPTAFAVQKAVYTRTALFNSVDVWAQSAAGQNLVVTGTGLATTRLQELPGQSGKYYAHVQQDVAAIPPATITVTNYTSNPVVSSTAQLADAVTATASYDPVGRTISVLASSSDQSGPALVVLGLDGGIMTPGAPGTGAASFTSAALPATEAPPRTVTVQSEAGGSWVANVWVGQTGSVDADALFAGNDVLGDFNAGTSTDLTAAVLANDTVVVTGLPVTGATFRVVAQGTNGTATGGATLTYTARPGVQGIDTFSYVLETAEGFSNEATVELNVLFVEPAPIAGNDSFPVRTGVARALTVAANDVAGAGGTINLASIVETSANATANANGTISYLAPANGTASFTYTIANNSGVASNAATVTVVAFGTNEAVALTRADHTVNGRTWNVRGSTTWFSAALTQQVMTCWLGTAAAPTATTLIGSAPISTTGAFQVVTAIPGPIPTPTGQRVSCQAEPGRVIGTLASRNR